VAALTRGLVAALPRRTVSRFAGWLATRRMPRFLLRPAIAAYVRRFRVDVSESDKGLDEFPTFQEFFARALKPGLRPLDPAPEAVLSPVDGRVHSAGPVEAGTVLQTKGVPYRVAELLGSEDDARALEGGTWATLYLSPRDYHRLHWPFDAQVDAVRHLPGDLWPVNDDAVARVPRLFARNERVAVLGRTAAGGRFAVVPVGALNVGSITLAFHALRTNRLGVRSPRSETLSPPRRVERGDELGHFGFGSAVVLLLSPAAGRLDPLPAGASVHVGRRIGTLSR
jgi:phosphatidylserine decarboxylase